MGANMSDQTPSPTNNSSSVNQTEVDLAEKVVNLRINEGTDAPLPSTTLEAPCFPQEYININSVVCGSLLKSESLQLLLCLRTFMKDCFFSTQIYSSDTNLANLVVFQLHEAGFEEPTLIQAQSWPLAIQGRDIIAIAKSGSGKKLGFLIPRFLHLRRLPNDPKRGPTVLVLCPTDDIAAQVHIEAEKFGAPVGIRATCLHRGETKEGQLELEGGGDVLVATLRQLVDILENGKLSLKHVAYLVLYEDELLLTVSVEPQIYQKVLTHLPSNHCQTIVFTTTWPREATDIASVLLRNPVMISVGNTTRNADTETITSEGLSGASSALVTKELMSPAKKKLLVLDINGILADFVKLNSRYSQQAHIMISGKAVFKRPFCADFLQFCFTNFEVGIWSSRNKNNLQKAVNYLLGELKNKLLFCWDQSKCTDTNLKSKENRYKPVFFKELQKLWENEEPGLPWQKGRFTKATTLLVDDSPYKTLRNPLYTAIFPEPYNFDNKDDESLGVGGDLRMYLEQIARAEDVQCFVKNNPFGQPAITESHPEWKYYLPAIKTFRNP